MKDYKMGGHEMNEHFIETFGWKRPLGRSRCRREERF
jgi:hypothetical protein